LAVILAVPFTSAVAPLIDVLVLDHDPPAQPPHRGWFAAASRGGARSYSDAETKPTRKHKGGCVMPVSTDSFDKLSTKIDEAKRAIRAAASQGGAELQAKIDEARRKADAEAAELGAQTRAAADRAEAHWDQIQSDWEQHRQSIRRRIDEAKAQQDLEDAERRAEWAEDDARDAVDFAANAIDEATYAMLDAIQASQEVKVRMEAASNRR
jgi:hypothetical protein